MKAEHWDTGVRGSTEISLCVSVSVYVCMSVCPSRNYSRCVDVTKASLSCQFFPSTSSSGGRWWNSDHETQTPFHQLHGRFSLQSSAVPSRLISQSNEGKWPLTVQPWLGHLYHPFQDSGTITEEGTGRMSEPEEMGSHWPLSTTWLLHCWTHSSYGPQHKMLQDWTSWHPS